MAWRPYNPNPWRLSTDDCAPRALSAVLRIPWGEAYDLLYENGKEMGLMQDNKAVTWAILKMNGFHREALPDQCPECYTVADFAADHPRGVYVVATDSHIIAIIGGDWLDAWDSGRCSCGCGCRQLWLTDYQVGVHLNAQIPEGGTVAEIIFALAVDGVIDPASLMRYTPTAAEISGNLGTDIIVSVPSLCGCESVAVVNAGTQPSEVLNGTLTFDYAGTRRIR